MIQYTQQVTAAGDGRVLHLVYDVSHVGGVARLVAVADQPPRRGVALPPMELESAQVEALAQLPAVLHQIDGSTAPTHVQVIYGPMRTGGTVRRAMLLWSLDDLEAVRPHDATRHATLAELFAHGGRLVGISERGPLPGLPRLVGRKVDASTYRALMLVGAQLTRQTEPVAA